MLNNHSDTARANSTSSQNDKQISHGVPLLSPHILQENMRAWLAAGTDVLRQYSHRAANRKSFEQAVVELLTEITRLEQERVSLVNAKHRFYNQKIRELIEQYCTLPHEVAATAAPGLQQLSQTIDDLLAELAQAVSAIDSDDKYVNNIQYAKHLVLLGSAKFLTTTEMHSEQIISTYKAMIAAHYQEKQQTTFLATKIDVDIKRLETEMQRLIEQEQKLNRELLELIAKKEPLAQAHDRSDIIKFELTSIKKLQLECNTQEQQLFSQHQQCMARLMQLEAAITDQEQQVVFAEQPEPMAVAEVKQEQSMVWERRPRETLRASRLHGYISNKLLLRTTKSYCSYLELYKNHQLLYWSIFVLSGVVVGYILSFLAQYFVISKFSETIVLSNIEIYSYSIMVGLASMCLLGMILHSILGNAQLKDLYADAMQSFAKFKQELNLENNDATSDPELSALLQIINTHFKEQFDLIEKRLAIVQSENSIASTPTEMFAGNLLQELSCLEAMRDIKIKLTQQLGNITL